MRINLTVCILTCLTLGTIAVRSVDDSNRQLYAEAQRRIMQQLYIVSDINIVCFNVGVRASGDGDQVAG